MRSEAKFLLVLAFWFFLFAEALSWVTASWPGDCIVNPEQNQTAADQAYQKNCPTFHVGAWIVLKRTDAAIGRHDKSIVAVFTVILALSTIGLWIATIGLFRAGEKQMRLIAINAHRDRMIGQSQVRAYVSIRSAEVYFSSDDAAPFIEIVAVNSGQSPALGFVFAPTIHYLADVEEEIVYDPGEEWMDQPGMDISALGGENKQLYFPIDFALVEKVGAHCAMPSHLGISITIEFSYFDVFGNQISDMASFAGVVELVDKPDPRHPVATSKWVCGKAWPIAKGEVWSGIAIKAPHPDDDKADPSSAPPHDAVS